MRMALSDAGNDPADTTTRKAYDLQGQMWVKPHSRPRRFEAVQAYAVGGVGFSWQVRFRLAHSCPFGSSTALARRDHIASGRSGVSIVPLHPPAVEEGAERAGQDRNH